MSGEGAVAVVPTAELPAALTGEIKTLLADAFGDRFTADDWQHCLGGRHVVITDGDAVVAHAAVVRRRLWLGERPVDAGYVEAVATAPSRQREGLGSRAMATVGDLLRASYDVGALSTGRPGFYRRLGWESWEGPSYVWHPHGLVRTPEEDAGLMIFRCGVPVRLTETIACEPRAGDDW